MVIQTIPPWADMRPPRWGWHDLIFRPDLHLAKEEESATMIDANLHIWQCVNRSFS
jgi:hypothetical protein